MTTHWVGAVASTNAVAREGLYEHGDVIATTEQTAGRGRHDRTWSMNPGEGVALTIVVDTESLGSPVHVTRIPLVTASVLAGVIADAHPTIKWPNDLHIDGAKVSGILVESLGNGRFGIGVGINLTGVPVGVEGSTPVSLVTAGVFITAEELVDRLVTAVLDALERLDSPATHAELERALDTIGREVLVELPDGRSILGLAVGLGETGSLLVETEGFVTELVAGDVTHLRHAG